MILGETVVDPVWFDRRIIILGNYIAGWNVSFVKLCDQCRKMILKSSLYKITKSKF